MTGVSPSDQVPNEDALLASAEDQAAPAIRVKGLSKRYVVGRRPPRFSMDFLRPWRPRPNRPTKPAREIWALRDLNLSVPRGTVLGVIGPNGAGKTTLLRILGRVTPPTSGRAVVRGRVISLLELGAAFQADNTGRENVYLNAAMHGIPTSVVDRRIDAIIEFADLGEFIDHPVKRYSSGMYLRLAFSVAINMEPDVLLADEVLAVGDLEFQERCLRQVSELGRAGTTVLFVSHDMAAIRRLCDRAILLNSGRIVAAGPTPSVVSQYEQSAWALVAPEEGKGAHVGEHGAILSTRLFKPGGAEIGAASVSDELELKMAVHIETPGCLVRPAFVFFVDGALLFRSVHPRGVRIDEAGIYTVSARLPGDILADTLYSVRSAVFITTPTGKESAIIRDNALSFRLYDRDEDVEAASGFGAGDRGIIRPRLDWDVERGAPRHPTKGRATQPEDPGAKRAKKPRPDRPRRKKERPPAKSEDSG
jgi:lipopolysaccharide transport system ATP-binding protein